MRKMLASLVAAIACVVLYSGAASAWTHGTAGPPSFYVCALTCGSTTGNDGNPGTQALPWKTLHKVNTSVFAIPGTTINFQGTFTGGDLGLNITTTVAPKGLLTFQGYGTGATINSSNSRSGFTSTNVGGLTVRNLTFVGSGATTNTLDGVAFFNFLGDVATGFQLAGPTVTNNTISGYGMNGIRTRQSAPAGTPGTILGFANVVVDHNTVHDVAQKGGNFLSCINIDNGGGYGSGKMNYNVLVQYNLVYNCLGDPSHDNWSGSGIIITGTYLALVQYNVAHDFGGTPPGDAVGMWTVDSNKITFQFNESYNGHGSGSFGADGFDCDGGTYDCVVQYNYSHNNGGTGVQLGAYEDGTVHSSARLTARYNVFEDNTGPALATFNFGANDAALTDVEIYNNTAIAPLNGGAVFGGSNAHSWSGIVKNNIMVEIDTSSTMLFLPNLPSVGSIVFDNNNYTTLAGGPGRNFAYLGTNYSTFAQWQAASGFDAHGNTSSPSFIGTIGGGGTCYTSGTPAGPAPCPTVYEVANGSPMRGAGAAITNQGARDYYGNAIPTGVGSGINIGADGH
jgi:hypothetical protein